jgi:hypothetical protein
MEPVRTIGSALKRLTDLRKKAKLPAEIDKRLGDSLSAIKRLPQMPLRERKEEARKQREELGSINAALTRIAQQGSAAMDKATPIMDLGYAVTQTMYIVADIAEGVSDSASSLDINV